MPFQTQNIPQRITLSLASLIGSFKTHQPPLFELHLRMVQWIHMTLVRILTPLRFLTWTWNKKIKSSEIRSRSFRKKITDLELFSRYGQTTPSRVQPPRPHTPSEYGSPGPHTPDMPSRSRRYGASPVSRGLYLGNSAVSHSNQANGSRSTSHTSTTFGRSSVYEPLLPYYINLYNLHHISAPLDLIFNYTPARKRTQELLNLGLSKDVCDALAKAMSQDNGMGLSSSGKYNE